MVRATVAGCARPCAARFRASSCESDREPGGSGLQRARWPPRLAGDEDAGMVHRRAESRARPPRGIWRASHPQGNRTRRVRQARMAFLRLVAWKPMRGRPRTSARTWCLVCCLVLGELTLSAQTAPPKEYQVKAVFLFNFAQFVEWPPAAFADDKSPIVIGILGDDPFGAYLDEVVRAE